MTRGDKEFIRSELDNRLCREWEKKTKAKIKKLLEIKDQAARERALKSYYGDKWIFLAQNYDLVPNPMKEVWKARDREQILNFRADGIGLLDASGYKYTNAHLDIMESLRQITGFLAGAPGNRYDKTHIYAPGEELKRGVILLSNANDDHKVKVEWKLELDGKTVAQKEENITLPAGETLNVPITTKIAAEKDISGMLSVSIYDVSGKKAKLVGTDKAQIDVLVSHKFNTDQKIALIDPERESATILRKAGIPFQQVPMNYDLSEYDIVIFGRKAFNYEKEHTHEGFDLGALTKAGKKVIVFEQTEDTLRNRFNLRTEYTSPRHAYPREFGGILFDGLNDSSLSHWRGKSTLTPGDEIALANISPRNDGSNGGKHHYIWNDGKEHGRPMKWTNRHNLATVMVIKPETGAYRTLADCGFGQNYLAAWQLDNENGEVIFSQFDVSGRTETGPEVIRYLQNLVTYAASLPKPQSRKTVYIGAEKGEKLLETIFVPFTKVPSPDNLDPKNTVLVLGNVPAKQLGEWKQKLQDFVSNGGTVFSLPKTQEQFDAGWTPIGIKTNKKVVNCTDVGRPTEPLLKGLGNSDFFWKGDVELLAMDPIDNAVWQASTGVLAKVKQGKGQWVFCQIDPKIVMPNKHYFWLKDSKWNTERLIRTLLFNCGCKMNPPKLLKKPYAIPKVLVINKNLEGEWQCGKALAYKPAMTPLSKVKKWNSVILPGTFRNKYPELIAAKGKPKALWYKRKFNLKKVPTGDYDAQLIIGAVSGTDITSINGKRIGSMTLATNPNDLGTANREYKIPPGILKQGENEITMFVDYRRYIYDECDGSVTGPINIKAYQTVSNTKVPDPISLDGWWKGHAVEGKVDMPDKKSRGWHRVGVPDVFDTQHAHWEQHDDHFWYTKTFMIPDELPANAEPTFVTAAIDDEDDTYINGKLIGHTGEDTNPMNYWRAGRAYSIPRDVLKVGKNTITIRVNDLRGSGGLVKPVKIVFEDPEKTKKKRLEESPYTHEVGKLDDPYQATVHW